MKNSDIENIHGRDLTGEQMAELLCQFAADRDEKKISAFIDFVTRREHRTIQQLTGCLLLRTYLAWAEAGNDARNEFTVKVAKAIKDAVKDIFFGTRFPYI